MASTTSSGAAAEGESTPVKGEEGEAGEGDAAAEQELAIAKKGYFTHPPTEPNPAAKNKSVTLVSSGQAAEVDSVMIAYMEEAAKLLGWKVNICDGKLDPATFGNCLDQALAAGSDGIVLDGIDCPLVKPQLEKAEASHVPVVGLSSWDCGEIEPGEPELMTKISYGSRFPSEQAAYEAMARGVAAWTIVESKKPNPEIIWLNNEGYVSLRFWQDGYKAGIEKFCPECKLNKVEWTAPEIGPKLEAKVSAALLQYPEATAMFSGSNPELGPSAALAKAGKTESVLSVGGVGLAPSIEEIREGTGIGATMAWPGKWYGFAAIDTLNSLFNGNEPRDEGWGGIVVDKTNLPPKPVEGFYEVSGMNPEAEYAKSWGVSPKS